VGETDWYRVVRVSRAEDVAEMGARVGGWETVGSAHSMEDCLYPEPLGEGRGRSGRLVYLVLAQEGAPVMPRERGYLYRRWAEDSNWDGLEWAKDLTEAGGGRVSSVSQSPALLEALRLAQDDAQADPERAKKMRASAEAARTRSLSAEE
jgi:hypothetical protein